MQQISLNNQTSPIHHFGGINLLGYMSEAAFILGRYFTPIHICLCDH